jgi:hypothetical protein
MHTYPHAYAWQTTHTHTPLIKYVVATIYKNCWGTSPDIKLSTAETKRYQGQREYAPAYPQDVVRHLMRISAVKHNTIYLTHTGYTR